MKEDRISPAPVAVGAAMRATLEAATLLAHVAEPVLIVGETGVGKETLARRIHALSAAAERTFVAVRCDARGAEDIERAVAEGAGTIFIRGLAGASAAEQALLARALDRAHGERAPRLVTALESEPAALERGTVAEELFYRLAVHELAVPPLRRRKEDILPLATRFLAAARPPRGHTLRGFTADAVAALEAYSWPGNVRELEACVARAALVAAGDQVARGELSFPGGARQAHDPALVEIAAENLRDARTRFERAHVERVLAKHGGDKQRAADALGIDLSSLYRKLDLKRRGRSEDDAEA